MPPIHLGVEGLRYALVMELCRALRRLLSNLAGVPRLDGRLDQLDSQVAVLSERMLDAEIRILRQVRAEMVAQGEFAVERSVEVARRIGSEVQAQEVADLRAEMVAQGEFAVEELKTMVNVVRAELSADAASVIRRLRALEASEVLIGEAPRPKPTVLDEKAGENRIPSRIYAGIEDVFRGDSVTVLGGQNRYKEYLGSVSAEFPLLDLGCGRGEWLKSLSDEGIPASGIDSNEWFVDQCRTNGLAVEHGDIFDHIRQLPDESLGAITLFQVVEHLPFVRVLQLFDEACRTLITGGVLIAEVPNAKNLRVGSGTFWIDPTHERPWYPELLEFLARQAGFAQVSGQYANPLRPEPDLTDLPVSVRGVINSFYEAIDGPADYAVVAYR